MIRRGVHAKSSGSLRPKPRLPAAEAVISGVVSLGPIDDDAPPRGMQRDVGACRA